MEFALVVCWQGFRGNHKSPQLDNRCWEVAGVGGGRRRECRGPQGLQGVCGEGGEHRGPAVFKVQGGCGGGSAGVPQVFRQWALLLACVVTGNVTCLEQPGREVQMWKCPPVRPLQVCRAGPPSSSCHSEKTLDTGMPSCIVTPSEPSARGMSHPGHSQPPGAAAQQGQQLRRSGTTGNVQGACGKKTWRAEAGREIGV